MKKVRIEEAIGMPICHDMTRIIPGEFKGVAFKRGHIIRAEDIPALKSMGKEHVFVGEFPEGLIHEDECAERIARAICNEDEFEISSVSEGKINITSKIEGVFKVNEEALFALNSIEDVAICTIFDNTPVNIGERVASERIIPLFTKSENINQVEELSKLRKPFEIKPFISQRVHLVTTGNEVFNGLIEDKSYPVLKEKVKRHGCNINNAVKAPDEKEKIKFEINRAIDEGADVVILTGGMSVDEDDMTPVAIKECSDSLVIHGTPVQPGNMFVLAYRGNIPILGLPGAVVFCKYTIFDIVFPLIASKQRITKEFFIRLAHGGLCRFCSTCHYPNCTFGKGR